MNRRLRWILLVCMLAAACEAEPTRATHSSGSILPGAGSHRSAGGYGDPSTAAHAEAGSGSYSDTHLHGAASNARAGPRGMEGLARGPRGDRSQSEQGL
jgi:hypothetical protein